MVTSAYPSAATFAFEKVISGVSPADAQFGFERPVFAQEPGVAVCDTDSTEQTLEEEAGARNLKSASI